MLVGVLICVKRVLGIDISDRQCSLKNCHHTKYLLANEYTNNFKRTYFYNIKQSTINNQHSKRVAFELNNLQLVTPRDKSFTNTSHRKVYAKNKEATISKDKVAQIYCLHTLPHLI